MKRIPDAIAISLLVSVAAVLVICHLRESRNLASAAGCQRNLKRIVFAMHEYHSAFQQLPPGSGGTWSSSSRTGNQGRLSGIAALLPFIDQQAAWETLSNPHGDFPSMGPSPSISPAEYDLWGIQFDTLLCPSDPVERKDYGLRSYMFCYGDGVHRVGYTYLKDYNDHVRAGRKNYDKSQYQIDEQDYRTSCRGAFMPTIRRRMRDLRDGMSNTIFLGESVVDVGHVTTVGSAAREVDELVDRPAALLDIVDPVTNFFRSDVTVWTPGRGSRWAEGNYVVNAFTTVLPPGSPSGTLTADPTSGIMSASSHHSGGVYIAMGDGALRFVSESIDCGDTSSPSVCVANKQELTKNRINKSRYIHSPYGVWGAMGTMYGMEVIPSEREADYKTIGRWGQ
jgi:hypothetical protein